MEDEIKETFYNLMLENALNLDLVDKLKNQSTRATTINFLITESVKTICKMSTQQGFPTIRGNWINDQNVDKEFAELFRNLCKLKLLIGSDKFTECLEQIVKSIQERGTFRKIIDQVINFYMEAHTESKSDITEQTIRDTFYNRMADEVLTSTIIDIDDMRDRDPYIYIALSSIAILSSTLHSLKYNGILLFNKAIVTKQTCPEKYKILFEQLILLKDKLKSFNFNDDQIQLIKSYSTTNPNIIIPNELEKYKTRELMAIVASVTSLSIQISSIAHFKEIIDDVIKFCLEAIGVC